MKDKDLEYYLSLPWTFTIEKHIEDNETFYVARIADIKGCMSDGETPVEAIENIQEALKLYIESELSVGNALPEPIDPSEFKGQISYRTKPEKHFKIAKEAQRRGVSINKLIEQAVDSLFTEAS